MSTMSSQSASGASSQTTLIRLGIALEVSTVYAGILLYIWRWQFTYPRAWMALFALVLASHVAHGDSLHDLGLTLLELRASAQAALPLATALFVPVAIYGLASGKLLPLAPGVKTIASFAGYGLWCVFQQYLTQSFFHNRLMRLASNHTSRNAAGLFDRTACCTARGASRGDTSTTRASNPKSTPSSVRVLLET